MEGISDSAMTSGAQSGLSLVRVRYSSAFSSSIGFMPILIHHCRYGKLTHHLLMYKLMFRSVFHTSVLNDCQ
jgi:hypothetical protein